MQKCAHLVDLEKCCQNAYFLANFRFDTAENEPAKNLQKFVNFADPNPLTLTPCREVEEPGQSGATVFQAADGTVVVAGAVAFKK